MSNKTRWIFGALVVVGVALYVVKQSQGPGEKEAASGVEPATQRSPAGEAAVDSSVAETPAGEPSVADPLTPDSDPRGVLATHKQLSKDISAVKAELSEVSASIRRRSQALYRDDPEISKLAVQARTLDQQVQGKVGSVSGRTEALEKLSAIKQEVKTVLAEIKRAEAHFCPLCEGIKPEAVGEGEAATVKTVADHRAEREAALADLRTRYEALRKESMETQIAAGRAESEALEGDTELDALVAQAQALHARINGLVMADSEISALVARREELVAREDELVRERDNAGDSDEGTQISKR